MPSSTSKDCADDPDLVLDHNVLDVLSVSVGEEVMGDLIAAGVADMRDHVQRLLDLAGTGDADVVRAVAHDLKSAAGSFGAMRLHNRARTVEVACREGRAADALASIAPVETAAEDAFAALVARFGLALADMD